MFFAVCVCAIVSVSENEFNRISTLSFLFLGEFDTGIVEESDTE